MANKKVTSNKPSLWSEHSRLGKAIIELNEINKTQGVEMRGGKKYTMVKDRVEIFRKHFDLDFGIETSIEYCDDTFVRMKAVITETSRFGDVYYTRVIGSGHAEELRGSTNVNKTSALENCETGAIGRALASVGLAGGEYASANEMEAVGRKETALKEKPTKKEPKPAKKADAGIEKFKATIVSPDGVETEVTVEDDARLEDLVFAGFETWIVDCDTDKHLDDWMEMNKKPIEVLRNSNRWDDFVELGKLQRAKIKEASEGESK